MTRQFTAERTPDLFEMALGPKESLLRRAVEAVGVGVLLYCLNVAAIPAIAAEPALRLRVLEAAGLIVVDCIGLNAIGKRIRG